MAAILKEIREPLRTIRRRSSIVSRCLENARRGFSLHAIRRRNFGRKSATDCGVGRRALASRPVALVACALIALASWMPWRPPRHAVEDILTRAQMSLLTDWTGAEEGAEISPDGKLVAFLSDHDGEWDLWRHPIGTDQFTNLTKDFPPLAAAGFVVRKLGFSADSSEIWFNPGDGEPPMTIPSGGGVPRPFLPPGTNTPAWSPDGHVVYIDKAALTDPMYVAEGNGADPKTILAPGTLKNMNPVYSQDGRWIYFTRGLEPMDESSMDVWRLSPSGGQAEQLSNQHLGINYLAPLDARTLLFVARAEDRSGPWLWAFDVDTHQSRRMPLGVHRFTSVSVSRDGQRIVATVDDRGASLWSVPITGRIATESDAHPRSARTGHDGAVR